jgi:hypothetical protein
MNRFIAYEEQSHIDSLNCLPDSVSYKRKRNNRFSLMKARYAIIVLLLTAFIGQSMAAVIPPCSMMDADDETPVITQIEGMHHADHGMADMPDSAKAAVDCCGDGICALTSCLWSPAFSGVAVSPPDQLYASALNSRYAFSYLAPELASLFRPPIIR